MIWQLWQKPGSARKIALFTVFTLLSMAGARAQQATRTQLNVSKDDGKLVLEANVADVESTPLSEGSVSFETGNGSLGSALVQNGEASLTVSALPPGTQSVTAVYHPATTSYAVSASAPAVAEVTATLPGFTVTATPSSASVEPGNFATILLTAASVNGFTGVINLSCSNLPAQAACNFTPVTVTLPANGTATSSLQITTDAPSGTLSSQLKTPAGPRGSHVYYAMLLPGGIAVFGLFALRRRNGNALRLLGLVALLGVSVAGLTACNARYDYLNHGPYPNTGTPAGTYSIIVAAYSSNGSTVTQATTTSSGCTGAVCVALTVQ